VNLIYSKWKSDINLCDLIEKFPHLIDIIEEEFQNNLYSLYGEYSLNLKLYNINDFFANVSNKMFKIKEIKLNEKQMFEKYLIITDKNILICTPIDVKNKTKIKIDFYSLIIYIKEPIEFSDNKNKENLSGIIFEWEEKSPFIYENIIFTQPEERKEIIDEINTKKLRLLSKFKYFFNDKIDDIQILKEIAEIKEKIFNKFKDEFTFESLNKIYQKLIEIYSKIDDDNFKVYNEKLKKLLIEYDNLLTGKSN